MATGTAPSPSPGSTGRHRRPAIVAVDDEPAVLAAVARDLRRGFGERYRDRARRVGRGGRWRRCASSSGRGEQVALLVADQRMPGMAGTEYLVQARAPRAPSQARAAHGLRGHRGRDPGHQRGRAGLLPAQALGPAGGAALPRPRGPPDHLGGAARRSSRGGVRVVGHRFSKRTHDLRDFLARNRVPSRWLDVERDGEARELLTVAGVDEDGLPVVLLEDGTVLEQPTVLELAERLGVAAQPVGRPLRPRHRRRRPGRPGGRGLRRVGGPADAHGRARGARAARPGSRAASRTTSASPTRAQRRRPGPARDRPGPAARRRAADDPGRDRAARRGRRAGSSSSSAAATLAPTRVLVASGVVLPPAPTRPGSRSSPAPASTTARR